MVEFGVGARIDNIHAASEHGYRASSGGQCPFVGRSIDPVGESADNGNTPASEISGQSVGDHFPVMGGSSGADDADGIPVRR